MDYQDYLQVKNYLARFDEILNEMATKMLNPSLTNNITLDRIQDSNSYSAVTNLRNGTKLDASNNAGCTSTLQNIANEIIVMQQKGIKQMEEIARTTKGYDNSKYDVNMYLQKYFEITNNMLERMQNSRRMMDINLDFVSEMIPHHEGAIQMCKNLLMYRIDPRLVQVANTIIKEQSKGVVELKEVEKELW